MALKEEFDFATFRCAFCNALNPSRKARPVAPPLPLQQGGTPNRITSASDSSDSSSTSDYDEHGTVCITKFILCHFFFNFLFLFLLETVITKVPPPAIITTEANLPEANNAKETETVENDNDYDGDADADDDIIELNKENENESESATAHINEHLSEDSKHNDEYKKEM